MADESLFFIDSLGELYQAVQQQKIFTDSKLFVDAIPGSDPAAILEAYRRGRHIPEFDLKQFVLSHFTLPEANEGDHPARTESLLQYLDDTWNELVRPPDTPNRGTLIPLPYSYIVPGGRFREVYYWDSYFTLLGLQVSGRTGIIRDMVNNFAYLINRFGYVPNGNRTYYLSRSQPPYFTMMVELLANDTGEAVLSQYQPEIEKEYNFWMHGAEQLTQQAEASRHVVRLPNGTVLNRFWDTRDTARPEAYAEDSKAAAMAAGDKAVVHRHLRAACESGWDFSTRWFRDGLHKHTVQAAWMIPVDLNCLLLHTEEVLLQLAKEKQHVDKIGFYSARIAARKSAIEAYCWNNQLGFYFDYQFKDKGQASQFTLAATFPLFFSVATTDQAKRVAECLETKFLQQHGLATTLTQSGQQWDRPNGWAPLQWIAYRGLKNYGHHRLAAEIRKRWMLANEQVFTATGKMMEKYDVTEATVNAGGGEYVNQTGFGWTNGVYLKFTREA